MKVFYVESSIEDFAARIYCFSEINELWTFKEEVGAAVWIHLLERREKNGKRKTFKFSLEGNRYLIYRTK